MESDDVVKMSAEPKKPFMLFRIWQWLVVCFMGLITTIIASEWSKLNLPGTSQHLYWVALFTVAIVTLFHIPPLFFRLMKWLKVFAYLVLIVGLSIGGEFLGQVHSAYERTPEGRKEAVARMANEQREVAAIRKREEGQAMIDELAAVTQKLDDINKKIEGCFSWGHRLPALETQVQESLHNPDSFEQVETVSVVPDENGYNIVMQFRAENGFGAKRIGTAKARLIADDCGLNGVIIEN